MKIAPLALAAVMVAVLGGSPANSEEPGIAPKPLFKRLTAPTAGQAGRITVQIDPEQDYYLNPPEKPAPLPEPEVTEGPVPAQDASPGVYAAYWSAISPSISDAGPGRLDDAVAALRMIPGLKGPRLNDMRRITDRYGPEILQMTVGTRISPALVAAIISVESAGRVEAVSSAGAQGVMQLMPATAERFGVADWSIPEENIRGGIAYLDWLAGHFDMDPLMILAGYNAGEGAVREYQGVPPYAETRDYVPKVLAAWKVASGLCLTPPRFFSDGCVFAGSS